MPDALMERAKRAVPTAWLDSIHFRLIMQTSSKTSLAFVAAEAGLIAVAAWFGGPAWTAMTVLALLAEVTAGSQLVGLALLLPAFGWLAAAQITENRELFFPFAITLAACMACRLRRRSFAAAVAGAVFGMGVFLAIRLAQQASWQVLTTEAAVTAGILLVIAAACRWLPERAWATGLVMAVAAGLGYAGLAV